MAGFGGHRLDGKNALAYMGVRPVTPARFIVQKRAPLPTDYINYPIGTQWLYVNNDDLTDSVQYALVSVAENTATWLPLNESGIDIAPDHSVLLGTGTTTIGSVGPSYFPGLPLLSQGDSADPSFGTLGVLGGGTGQYDLDSNAILIGNGTDPILFIDPISADGIPLISQDSASPIYGVASVAGGGTGQSNFSPYTVICAGNTSNNPFQNVADVGTAGYVLTSNGLGQLPSWQPVPGEGGSGTPISIQVFTTSQTYTPTSGMTSCIVELVGGGAGGQSVDTSSSNPIGGNGGGGGGYCKRFFLASTIGASQPVVIGAGGAADSNGGGSTFGSGPFMDAGGGIAALDYSIPGYGGVAVGGDFNVGGGNGGISSGTQTGVLFAGFGGSSFYGSGGLAQGDNDAAGDNGVSYGAGGSGANALDPSMSLAGGEGSSGICIITEFGNEPGEGVATLTGNSGGAVGPDGGNNINIIGSGDIVVTGNPGTNTLTISTSSNPIQLNVIYYRSGSGTYTPTSGMFQVMVECIGGGAAGGGAGAAASSYIGGGGGAGGYCRELFSASYIGASQPYSVGAGGTGVSAGTGNSGGMTTFGTTPFMIAYGGNGGSATSTHQISAGGDGGSAVGGNLNLNGGYGVCGFYSFSATGSSSGILTGLTGTGGSSYLSPGAAAVGFYLSLPGGSPAIAGTPALGYGAGGSGAQWQAKSSGSGQNAAGGNGSGGIIIITEYIS